MLDNGLGTPRHPLFLLGMKYSNADKPPSPATAAKPGIGSLRSWYAGKQAASRVDVAAVQSGRHSTEGCAPQQSLSMVPQHPAHPPSAPSSPYASSLRHRMTPGQQLSTQAAVSVGSATTYAPPSTHAASMQLNGNMSGPSWVRSHPSHPSTTAPLQPAAHAEASATRTHTSASSAQPAIDLEAQNGLHCTRHPTNTPQNSPADMVTVVPDGLDGCDSGYDSGCGNGEEGGDAADEPADVAAERARTDRLWAARGMHDGGVTAMSGPAILLHNLRKVCQAHRVMLKAA